MGKFIRLTEGNVFAEDLFAEATPTGVRWTSDLCPHGLYAAVYEGGTADEVTGEVTGGTWVETGGPDSEALKNGRMTLNNDAYSTATRALTADYPQLEKDTWPTQDKESTAWVADPEGAITPFLNRAASERGIGREEYIRRTLIKAKQFVIMSSFLTGRRQKYEDQIKSGVAPVIDFTLTPDVIAELQAVQAYYSDTPASQLKDATI
ncbi:hypothetical protein NAV33_07265 [Pseudomonas stutzeri]|uniref:hypothetical protein n=1 Tax=Stutzerimonas stutzeri TaxID=316 RepID=UPI00210D1216|nr:hypothetical protein [Stutzerimonas stutzeri]MCQ4311693.1 hypothetical protein [Stutzerimonas stutzeri]